MSPEKLLPFDDVWNSADKYVDSLLGFVSSHALLRTFCGGVHILDFFTSDPDLYTQILPPEWREFFAHQEIMNILDLLMREDLHRFDLDHSSEPLREWRNGPPPPATLLEYIRKVREHLLLRDHKSSQCARNRALRSTPKLARHVAVGMTIKKVHEVGLFASYIHRLAEDINSSCHSEIKHLVDFGSGQSYLGRALASDPYNSNIIAIESKSHNAERARELDVMAKLATKERIMRNKKAFRAGVERSEVSARLPTPPSEPTLGEDQDKEREPLDTTIQASTNAKGRIKYVEHRIQDGDLTSVVSSMNGPFMKLMVVSLHSCGNLVHHGLRSLILNPTVKAVAMVGCCYNLVTERLGPATYKIPGLRPTRHSHPRLSSTGEAKDPHGFPMSARMCQYGGIGIRLNITARMMAVQAPQNWGEKDSENFFTRHFYRALLQRIFLDRGIVGPPSEHCVGGSPSGHSSGTPIVIGSLPKACHASFVTYVRGALAKLVNDPETGDLFRSKMAGVMDSEIETYEVKFGSRRKELSIIWSLMAFSAGVIEAAIVVDRWLWLLEQKEVEEAWVEPVFNYEISPRNLVIVGIKE